MDQIKVAPALTIVRRNIENGNWCWMPKVILEYAERGVIDARSVAVYMALARHANAENACWPSVGLLAQTLGMTRDTVRDRLHRLEAAKLIVIRKRWGLKGESRSHYYILLEPAPLPPCESGLAEDDGGRGDPVARGDGVAGGVGDAVATGAATDVKGVANPSEGNYPLPPEGVIDPNQGHPRRPDRQSPGDDGANPRRPDRHEQDLINDLKLKKNNVVVVGKQQDQNNNNTINNNKTSFSEDDGDASSKSETDHNDAEAEFVDWAIRRFQARFSAGMSSCAREGLKDVARRLFRMGASEWWEMALTAAEASGRPNASGVRYAVGTAIATNSPPKPTGGQKSD